MLTVEESFNKIKDVKRIRHVAAFRREKAVVWAVAGSWPTILNRGWGEDYDRKTE